MAQNLSSTSCGGDSMSSIVNMNSLRERESPIVLVSVWQK